jgi:hypothetical protein
MSRVVSATLLLAVIVTTCVAKRGSHNDLQRWEKHYAPWRNRELIGVDDWHGRMQTPEPKPFTNAQVRAMDLDVRAQRFDTCLQNQSRAFTDHVLKVRGYRRPDAVRSPWRWAVSCDAVLD